MVYCKNYIFYKGNAGPIEYSITNDILSIYSSGTAYFYTNENNICPIDSFRINVTYGDSSRITFSEKTGKIEIDRSKGAGYQYTLSACSGFEAGETVATNACKTTDTITLRILDTCA